MNALRQLRDLAAVVVIIAVAVMSESLLLGIVALLLLRILDVLIDIRRSLDDGVTDESIAT